jgi:hypothetical protein
MVVRSKAENSRSEPSLLDRTLIYSGLLFFGASAFSLIYGLAALLGRITSIRVGGILSLDTGGATAPTSAPPTDFAGILAVNFNIIAASVFAVISAAIGMALLKQAGRSTNYVIRPEDRDYVWPLIKDEKVQSIDQYIRLASLSGFSGAFTKIGFTGLPLATVALTIIFVVLSLATGKQDLMELAKLTLGAFIGSFVQRQVERGERQAPGSSRSKASQAGAPRLPV